MQISGQDPIRFLERYLLDVKDVSGASPVSGTTGQQPTNQDQVEISLRGKEAQALLHQVNALPDVRTDLVNSIRQQIASGQYTINDQKIAAGLVRSTLQDAML